MATFYGDPKEFTKVVEGFDHTEISLVSEFEPEPEYEIFPECMKNAILSFISHYKRFPNREEFGELKAEHITYPEQPVTIDFAHGGTDFQISVGFKGQHIPSVDLGGGVKTNEYFIPEEGAPVTVSALHSTKGMNTYNVSEEWLTAVKQLHSGGEA